MVGVTPTSLRVVTRALAQVEPEIRRKATTELHAIGSLVANDAQRRATATLAPRTATQVSWTRMRVGVSTSSVYVVPRNKGVRGKGPKRRRNFAPLMLDRAMRPALASNKPQAQRRYQSVVSAVCSRFNRGGLSG